MRRRALLAALAVALLAGCSSPREPREPRAPSLTLDDRLLSDLAMMARGAPPTAAELARDGDRLRRGELSLEGHVAELLADPRFARDVAPEILLNKKAVDLSEELPWETLRSLRPAAGPVIFYLRRPCAEVEAVAVHPWWAPDTEVRICPDSYQPTHLRDPKSGWYCGGDNLDPARSPYCGCGPALMNCARDEEQSGEIRRALRLEVTRTIAHGVEHDWPIARLFTTNETVRTGYSEFVYERWQLVRGERTGLSDPRAWALDGAPAARRESVAGQHAGLLTTPHLLLFGDTPRARMRNAFADLWCVPPASANVTTEQVLGLGVTDLRDGDGWKTLAAMPVCTECHARLDHGMQFFRGYPSSFVGVVFDAPASPGPGAERGQLFGRNLADPRGEGELSPRGFARLAVAQPEFGRCMVRDVTDHVFGGRPAPDDERALDEAFRRDGTLRSVVQQALVRYARRPPGPAERGAQASESRLDERGELAPSPALARRLSGSCGACHASGERAFVAAPSLPRATAEKMLAAVAFGTMPRAPVLMDETDRSLVVAELIDALFADEPARREARRYFGGAARGLPVHRGSAILRLIEERAGARDEEAAGYTVSDAERHDAVALDPSFALTLALAALRACKAAGAEGQTLDACLGRALDVRAATKAPARR